MTTTSPEPERSMHTSGALDPVWIHKQPYSAYPKFSPLTHDLETDICIVGAGISGIQTAYELACRGKNVVIIEARDILSGETNRTSSHLTNNLEDGYLEIAKKHGKDGAKVAAQSHAWARDRIGEIAKELRIDCEYRRLPAYDVSQFPVGEKDHDDELKELKDEAEYQKKLGIETRFDVCSLHPACVSSFSRSSSATNLIKLHSQISWSKAGPARSISEVALSLTSKQPSTQQSIYPVSWLGSKSSPTSSATLVLGLYPSRKRVSKSWVLATSASKSRQGKAALSPPNTPWKHLHSTPKVHRNHAARILPKLLHHYLCPPRQHRRLPTLQQRGRMQIRPPHGL